MEPEAQQRYSHVTRAMSETPWAILEGTFLAIAEAISLRARGQALSDQEVQARIGSGPASRVGYTSGSVAVLPLYGTIFPRANLIQAFSGGTSLQQWAASFDDAVRDPRIDAILLDVHSPGGSTFLVAETARKIRAARAEKPIVAIANALCCSAAYHLASQASELAASPSALIGSIGVFMAHEDWSRAEDMIGLKTSLIYAGRYKVEGNEHEPLSDDAKQAMQAIVDDVYRLFVSDVAAGRGTTPAKVENGYGEGRVLTATQALAEGMVDRIETFDQTLERLKGRPAPARGGTRSDLEAAAPDPDPDPDPDPEPEPVPPAPDPDEPEDEQDPAEAFAAMRAVSADMRERTELSRAAMARREITTQMRSRPSTPGDD